MLQDLRASFTQTTGDRLERTGLALAAGLALTYLALLLVMFHDHTWIVDEHGIPLVTDFLEVWVAGKTALAGSAPSVYDPHLHHAAQAAALGHDFTGFLGWHYPPAFLFVASGLAYLPYAVAFVAWSLVTLVFYALSISAVAQSRLAIVSALALPAVLANIVPGQNGFLTAALIAASLLALERRPVLSGILLGLLTYKPQFGLLLPLALMADGRWRAIASAIVTGIALSVAAFLIFGGVAYQGFFAFLPSMSHAVLVEGSAGWWKLQSVYGFCRWLGAPNAAAWSIQGAVMLTLGGAVIWLWRQRQPFALKAAALAAAIPFMTPYLYMYDLPMLMVPLAFLYRDACFDETEMAAAVAAYIALAAFVALKAPIGPFAAFIVCGAVARRIALRSAATRDSSDGMNFLELAAAGPD